MNRRVTVAIAALALGAFVLSNTTWRKRRQERAILEDRVGEYASSDVDPLVDVGVDLTTVVADPNGVELLEGKPRLRVVRARRFGGVLDTRARRPCLVAPSRAPVRWYCSEDQESVILHAGDPLGQLVYGSEGAGKTTVTAIWHYLRWLEHLGEGREGGQTAPTKKRLKMVLDEITRLYPASWFRFKRSEGVVAFCDGTRLQLMHTHERSASEGSPIQGFNWSWCAREEGQDQVERHEDIESRGRAAKNGRYQQLITATAKDSSTWRDFRDALTGSGLWVRRTLLGRNSPFVDTSRWDAMERTMSPREYARRVLAQDVPPELAVYYGWDRKRNLKARPQIATDVTPAVLAGYQSYVRKGARFTLLCGHDPGVIFNTTEICKLIMFGTVPTWMVVGEFQTHQTTAREHALGLRRYLAENFGVERTLRDRYGKECPDPESPKALVFCDPHGKGQAQTDYQAVYMAMQHEGLDVFSPSKERIKRSARVEMENRLLCDARGVVRLLVGLDEQGRPLAPKLIEAYESLEKRPGDDNAEGTQRKDKDDKTHAPAALAYGLWSFEQEAFTAHTIKVALDAARRAG